MRRLQTGRGLFFARMRRARAGYDVPCESWRRCAVRRHRGAGWALVALHRRSHLDRSTGASPAIRDGIRLSRGRGSSDRLRWRCARIARHSWQTVCIRGKVTLADDCGDMSLDRCTEGRIPGASTRPVRIAGSSVANVLWMAAISRLKGTSAWNCAAAFTVCAFAASGCWANPGTEMASNAIASAGRPIFMMLVRLRIRSAPWHAPRTRRLMSINVDACCATSDAWAHPCMWRPHHGACTHDRRIDDGASTHAQPATRVKSQTRRGHGLAAVTVPELMRFKLPRRAERNMVAATWREGRWRLVLRSA